MKTLLAITAAVTMAQWEPYSVEERDWYLKAYQPDNLSPCCGESDAYYADDFELEGNQYVAIITDDREVGGRPYIAPGTRIVVPNEKLMVDQGNPTGHGVLFVSRLGMVWCYSPPSSI